MQHYYDLLQQKAQLFGEQKQDSLLHEECDDEVLLLYSKQQSFRKEIEDKLNSSFRSKQSASMILIGNQYESKKFILASLQSIIKDFLISESAEISIQDVRKQLFFIDGAAATSDQDAFTLLSDQLLGVNQPLLNNMERNITTILLDLENYFHQCRINNVPAIILVDSFHCFANYKRQTFIYTLLDFVHKSELFFLVIGLTEQVDLDKKLEKRVLSRLNSQYYYMHQFGVPQLCQYMLKKLILPKPTPAASSSNEDLRKFSEAFNLELCNTFGSFLVNKKKGSASDEKDKEDGDGDLNFLHNIDIFQDLYTLNAYEIHLSKAGSAFPILQTMIDWGKPLEFFDGIIYRLSLSISEERPSVKLEMVQEAIDVQEKPTLLELLSHLSLYQKQIYAVIARIQVNQPANHHDFQNPPGESNSFSNVYQYIRSHYNNSCPVDGKKEIPVQTVLQEFHQLSGGLLNKLLSVSEVVNILVELANYGLIQLWNMNAGLRNQPLIPSAKMGDIVSSIDERTVLTTNHTQYEITAAFKLTAVPDPIYSVKPSMNHPSQLVISETFRRAVLQPKNPILIEHPVNRKY